MRELILTIFVAGLSLAAYGQGVPVGTTEDPGCFKDHGQGYVDCYHCWTSPQCGPEDPYSPGCYGNCDRPCGTCVQVTLNDLGTYDLTAFDADGNIVLEVTNVVITSVVMEDDNHTFTRYSWDDV